MITSNVMKNEKYWEQFSVLPADLDYLVNYLVDCESPKTIEELTEQLIHHRHEQQVGLMEKTLSQGRIYRPGESFEEKETIVFPHMGNLLGEVVAIRPGRNPEHEPFSVLEVQMEDGSERQFAADLRGDHPLDKASYMPAADASPQELYEQYGGEIGVALRQTLEQHGQFVSVAGHQWFVSDLLMEVSVGQLNIAEALLDMNDGGPLPTHAFLDEMDLPEEIPERLQLFSLEYALLHDGRFDEVGPAGRAMWYLRRMEPKAVLEIPSHLRYMPIPYNRSLIDDTMLSLERQMDDEWSETTFEREIGDEVTVVLSYPHWRSGTLPLTKRLSKLFPTARVTDRIRFTFVDADTEEEFPGWVVRSNRYVYGLEDWYEQYDVGVGTYVDLKRREEPGLFEVGVRQFRSRRGEWLRTVSAEDGRLSFEVTRVPIACEFDELVAIAVLEPEAVDALAEQLKRVSLESLIDQMFQELAVLSLQRAVHAMTLYSVINLVRRVPPAPLMAVLTTAPQYVSLGDNYWAYRGDN